MEKFHAQMHIGVINHGDTVIDAATASLEITGCNDCLENAIIMLLVHNERFRNLINKCGNQANEIRKGGGSVNPQHN
jgi:hypothetical protein